MQSRVGRGRVILNAGATAESVCSYMTDIHLYLLGQLRLLVTEMSVRIIQYAEGDCKIEDDRNCGEIAEESLDNQMQLIATDRMAFVELVQELEETLAKVSDVIEIPAPFSGNVERGFQETGLEVERLWETIGEYEAAHTGSDFVIMEGMMDKLESLIEMYRGKDAAEIENYQKQDILRYSEIEELRQIGEEQAAYFRKNMEALQKAIDTYENRINAEIREEEGKQKIIQGAVIVAGAFLSAAIILGSGFSATPVVVVATWEVYAVGALTFTSSLYGLSEMHGEFVSLYPGAESSRVLSAIEKGGTIWTK